MKRLIAVLCVVGLPALALADWQPGDGHKMHFPQLPDEDGWNVRAYIRAAAAPLAWACQPLGHQIVKNVNS